MDIRTSGKAAAGPSKDAASCGGTKLLGELKRNDGNLFERPYNIGDIAEPGK